MLEGCRLHLLAFESSKLRITVLQGRDLISGVGLRNALSLLPVQIELAKEHALLLRDRSQPRLLRLDSQLREIFALFLTRLARSAAFQTTLVFRVG